MFMKRLSWKWKIRLVQIWRYSVKVAVKCWNFIFLRKEKVVKQFIPQCQKLVGVLRKTRITSLTFVLIFFFILSYTAGPNLDKKCIWLSDAAPSHKICRKIYFVVKPYEKVLWGWWNFKCPFCVKRMLPQYSRLGPAQAYPCWLEI